MKHSDTIDALAAALASAQGQMEGATKASENPFYKHRYADLASVWSACRKPLSDNGLAVIQTANVFSPGETRESILPVVTVTTLLAHNSGQWVSDDLTMWPRENTPQAIGTCISYARRYALAAMVGVYQEDDDGEKAEGRGAADTMETAVSGLGDVLDAIRVGDAQQMRSVWNEANVLGTSGRIWRELNTKQKKTARDLLQQTATPEQLQAQPKTVEGNGNGEKA